MSHRVEIHKDVNTNKNWESIEKAFKGLSEQSQKSTQETIFSIINANKILETNANFIEQNLILPEPNQDRIPTIVDSFKELKERMDFNEHEFKKLSPANAKFRLTLLSAYGDIDAYHPKVIHFKSKWNGYYYWMVFTPYPGGDQAKENPHLLVSNDLITWVEPNGYKNPLEPQPSGTPDKQYNSDTHIVYNPNLNRIEVFWRFVDDTAETVTIYRKSSSNGVDWSKKEVVFHNNRKNQDYLSPAIIFEDNKYKLWFVGNGYKVLYTESESGINWNTLQEIQIPFENNMYPWHLDVIHTDKGYEMVLVAFTKGQDRNTMSLFYTVSSDNINYTKAKKILSPSEQEFTWDNRGIYRACIMKKDDTYFIFYSAVNKKWERGTGICFGKQIEHLTGLEQHEVFIQNNIRAINMVYKAFLRNYGLQLSVPRNDGSFWKACLRFNSKDEVKFVDEFNLNNLIKLAVSTIKSENGMNFTNSSSYYNAKEFKLTDDEKAAIVGIGNSNFLRVKSIENPDKAGGIEVSSIILEDHDQDVQTACEGSIRYNSKIKKHQGYNGIAWHDLY
ncbi:hypothetical protein BK731_29250 [Bacillus thuringiensis serovar muju]|nr:hypothetical protein [Bacillus thuringiensis]MBH0350442.1 hypothetical protein [Bacillus thuringiensis]OTX99191.1 hypothetical protein BK731_29250 [Bacillus thuringiensis serovar muju]